MVHGFYYLGETASVVSKQSCVLFWMYGCVATEK